MMAAAGLAFPMLRATAFAFSPAMAIFYGLIAFHLLARKMNSRWRAGMFAVLVGAIVLSIYFYSGLAEQSHVFRLVIDKLRFALIKPQDPSLLSYETRSVWIEDFNSPGWNFLLYTVSLPLLTGVAGLIVLFRHAWQNRMDREAFFLVAFGAIFLLFFVLARRMVTIEIIFLAIAAAALLLPKRKFIRVIAAASLALSLGFEGWKSYNFYNDNFISRFVNGHFPAGDLPQAFTIAEHADMLNWLRVNVKTDEPVLASMGFSPVILAYTARPIIIHSMFDAKIMRDKVQSYVEALYGSESQFFDFAVRYGARYFVYESRNLLFDGPNSDRYVAGHMQPSPDSAVYHFHFQPEKLKNFQLVYENAAYRVFRTGPPEDSVTFRPMGIPVYNVDIMKDGGAKRVIAGMRELRNQTIAGFQAGAAGDIAQAIRIWEEVRRRAPYSLDINAQLCLVYLITKNIPEAAQRCEAQLKQQAHSPIGHYHAALVLEQTGQIDAAMDELRTVLAIDPRFLKAATRLNTLSSGAQK